MSVLVILEDHRDRIDEFAAVIQSALPDLNTVFFTTAPAFVEWFGRNLSRVSSRAVKNAFLRRDTVIFKFFGSLLSLSGSFFEPRALDSLKSYQVEST